MGRSKRTPIRGLGADAFFSEPQDAQNEQQDSIASQPAEQQTSKTVNQQLVKATFYLTTEHIATLEEVRLKIMRATGERKDKSALIREAIDLLAKQHTS
jgi:hypothetical protein